jgi:membrane associated rhomboid family serine protease
MLLPIRTNIPPRRTPYANYALIALNVVVFLLQFGVDPETRRLGYRPWVQFFVLVPGISPWWTFVTYAFLHANIEHIFFNMFFLYLFGRNVNDKFGHWGYVVFYLFGATASGLGQAVLHTAQPAATLGASGAVAAVTGAYLVLFPQSLITVIYWFFFIGTIEIPALYLIILKMIVFDNILARARGGIAYDAHLAGYAYGIVITLLLLITHLVSSSQFDLWAMIKLWNRRRQYRDTVAGGYDPFMGQGGRRRVASRPVSRPAVDPQVQARIDEIRHGISQRITERNLPAAAQFYLQLMQIDRNQVLPRQYLLDIANQLASDHHSAEAAQAYEQFLNLYSSYEHAEQVELMLGILYARYLNQPQEAQKHLQKASEKLKDPSQLDMCRQELARLQS